MDPKHLSEELRNGTSPDLNRRRWIIGLSLLGVAVAKIVSLYQTGIIKKLPDPPVKIFDSDKVDASSYAYKRLDTPDAFMMLTSYGITASLAAAGGINRAKEKPWVPIVMGVKTLLDSATAIQLGREEWKENKKLCFYCQVATVASLASVAIAIPEVVTAIKNLSGTKHFGAADRTLAKKDKARTVYSNALAEV